MLEGLLGRVVDHGMRAVHRVRDLARVFLLGFALDSLYERFILKYILRNSLVGTGPFFAPQVLPKSLTSSDPRMRRIIGRREH
jgi:hypothetical protein